MPPGLQHSQCVMTEFTNGTSWLSLAVVKKRKMVIQWYWPHWWGSDLLIFICFNEFVFFLLKAITTGGVTYNDKPWHRECFTCIGCKKQLSGQRFTSRENYPYCLECFSNLYAKKCVGCTKPITSKSKKLDTCLHSYLCTICNCCLKYDP